jgi:hypothetical protein
VCSQPYYLGCAKPPTAAYAHILFFIIDHMAKEAMTFSSINRTMYPNTNDVFELLKDHYQILGPTLVRNGKTGLIYLNLFPNGKPWAEKVMPRRNDVVVTRLRLHSCRLNKYLHKIDLHPSGLCDVCGINDTVEHFLFDCEKHKELTVQLRQLALAKKIR